MFQPRIIDQPPVWPEGPPSQTPESRPRDDEERAHFTRIQLGCALAFLAAAVVTVWLLEWVADLAAWQR